MVNISEQQMGISERQEKVITYLKGVTVALSVEILKWEGMLSPRPVEIITLFKLFREIIKWKSAWN